MKYLFSLLIVIIKLQLCYAQNGLTEAENFFYCSTRLEAHAGVNMSNQSGSDLSDSESIKFRPGLNLGFNIYQETMSGFSIGTGIAFEQKGSNYVYEPGDYFEEFPDGLGQANLENAISSPARVAVSNDRDKLQRNTILSYLTVPLNVGYAPIKKHKEFRVQTGLVPGILLSRKTNTNSFGSELSDSGTENLRTIDLGLMVGASYIFKNNIGVNLLYDHGLINTNTQEFMPKAFNRTIKLLVFYRLNFNPFVKSSYQSKK
jgi:hypothetical protein